MLVFVESAVLKMPFYIGSESVFRRVLNGQRG